MVEWAEHTLLHKINEIKKEHPVESIVVTQLEANTAIAQEFLDFLMRLVKDGERLKSLYIGYFHDLDEPLDKGLFERIAKKTDHFHIDRMPELNDEIRSSMTECIASFFAASEKLQDVDVSYYIENNQEAVTLARALRQSESITSIESL